MAYTIHTKLVPSNEDQCHEIPSDNLTVYLISIKTQYFWYIKRLRYSDTIYDLLYGYL